MQCMLYTKLEPAIQRLQQHGIMIEVHSPGANAATPIRQAASTSSTVNLVIVKMCSLSIANKREITAIATSALTRKAFQMTLELHHAVQLQWSYIMLQLQ
jgi:hypothetical protein